MTIWGRAGRAEETARAKALRGAPTWDVQGTEVRHPWLE